ncbi:MAG: hypothetical protein RR418_03605, partial [Clostridia bacterium]
NKKTKLGFTLAELVVAMCLTGIIAAAIIGVFATLNGLSGSATSEGNKRDQLLVLQTELNSFVDKYDSLEYVVEIIPSTVVEGQSNGIVIKNKTDGIVTASITYANGKLDIKTLGTPGQTTKQLSLSIKSINFSLSDKRLNCLLVFNDNTRYNIIIAVLAGQP